MKSKVSMNKELLFTALNTLSIGRTDFIIKLVNKLKTDMGLSKPHWLYGKKSECMFGYIAAILGKCVFIKQEDSGISYAKRDIAIPDYRMILDNNRELFVEVKIFIKEVKYFD